MQTEVVDIVVQDSSLPEIATVIDPESGRVVNRVVRNKLLALRKRRPGKNGRVIGWVVVYVVDHIIDDALAGSLQIHTVAGAERDGAVAKYIVVSP